MYTAQEDIEKILELIVDIQDGKISRNKNYYTLAKSKEYNRFKRAKLLLSLQEDLEKTAVVEGGQINLGEIDNSIKVGLFNPSLRYNRTVVLSKAELDLLKSQSTLIKQYLKDNKK